MKVLITDPLAKEGISNLRQAGLEVEEDFETKGSELMEKMKKGYNAMIVRSGTQVTKKIIDSAEDLKVIGRAGAGLDNIDLEAAKAKGVKVFNSPRGNTVSAAEHTIALMLALCRHVPQAYGSLGNKEWKREKYKGVELFEKTLGVIGLGRIGQEVAKRMKCFEMNVIAFDPYTDQKVFSELGVKKVELDELLSKADFITVHVPKNKETEGLLGEEEFEKMKDSVRIVNVARGGIVDEKALHKALDKGKVAGAALDVYEREPPEFWDLLELDNVVHTPHLGASTKEAKIRCATQITEKVINGLKG